MVREFTTLPRDEYLDLGLPSALRSLPDFLIADFQPQGDEAREVWLLEVKYRRKWSQLTRRSLTESLKEQVRTWGRVSLMLLLGEASSPYGDDEATPSRYLRVADLHLDGQRLVIGPSNKRWTNAKWTDFKRPQDVFVRLRESFDDETLIGAVRAARRGLYDV